MNDRDRLNQIRALRERLERLPASPQRDQLLQDVRRRAVDVESDTPTAPMRPFVPEADVRSQEAPSAPPTTRHKSPVPDPSRRRPSRRAVPIKPHHASVPSDSVRSHASVAAASAATAPMATPLLGGVRLCLDDDVVAPEPGAARHAAPWARGLRG